MNLKEFVETGFLQEANRRFFHPLGLALEVSIDDDGEVELSGIWDYRHEPNGLIYGGPYLPERDKAINVSKLFEQKAIERLILYGWAIQPIQGTNAS